MLKFDEKTAAFLNNAYKGADAARRRRANFDALRVQPADIVLDLGCGNGLLTADLARAVGSMGRVAGCDPSQDMLQSAAKICEGLDNVDLVEGNAYELPFENRAFDRAVSVQVFEYIPDVPQALRELARVMRRGGRVVIGDMHFGTFVWNSRDPERMGDVIGAWDSHFADGEVPSKLAHQFIEAGFRHIDLQPVVFTDFKLRPDSMAQMMLTLMEAHAWQTGAVSREVAEAWAEEQHALSEEGAFFFSITHYIWVAERL